MPSVWNVCWNDFFLCDYVLMWHGKEKKCQSHRSSSSSSSWKWWIEEQDFDRRRWQIEFFCHCQRAFWIFFYIHDARRLLLVTCRTSHRRLPINLRLNFDWMWHAFLLPTATSLLLFLLRPSLLFFSFLFVIVEVPVHFISNRTATYQQWSPQACQPVH